ncbi:MAG: CtsR family transcriptional regulator [Acutalibacteraceae bacterium]|nr:CtsR family transcriptional regulator [Bacillota bacterium]
MRMSEQVARYILDMLDSRDGTAEIRRNELADQMGCVPSQINYVITSRFTPEQGYMVESRRGGGGYIRITRVQVSGPSAMMHVVNSIGDSVDSGTARMLIINLADRGILSTAAAELMLAACGDSAFKALPTEYRDTARAGVLKQMLIKSTISQ